MNDHRKPDDLDDILDRAIEQAAADGDDLVARWLTLLRHSPVAERHASDDGHAVTAKGGAA